jgi:hypothetical protein
LPKLRRQFRRSPDPTRGEAGEISGVNRARLQAARMRQPAWLYELNEHNDTPNTGDKKTAAPRRTI